MLSKLKANIKSKTFCSPAFLKIIYMKYFPKKSIISHILEFSKLNSVAENIDFLIM